MFNKKLACFCVSMLICSPLLALPLKVVCRAIITEDTNILLVSDDGKLWSAPGGKLEGDETLEQCLEREVYEETGLKIKPQNLVYVFEFFDHTNHVRKLEFYFQAKIVGNTLSKDWKDQGGNVKFVKYFKQNEIAKLNVQPTFLSEWEFQDLNYNAYLGAEHKGIK